MFRLAEPLDDGTLGYRLWALHSVEWLHAAFHFLRFIALGLSRRVLWQTATTPSVSGAAVTQPALGSAFAPGMPGVHFQCGVDVSTLGYMRAPSD